MGKKKKLRKANYKQLVVLFLVIVLAVVAVVVRQRQLAQAGYLQAQFHNPDNTQTTTFMLEIANTPGLRKKGLMYRKKLAADEGMLFIFPNESDHSFWMKETYVSLDLVFLNSAFEVVGMLKELPILNERRRSISAPSKYVVELLAKSIDTHGIKKGSKLVVEGDLPKGI